MYFRSLIFFVSLWLAQDAAVSAEAPKNSGEQIQWFPALATLHENQWRISFAGLVTEDKSRPAISWLTRKLLGFSGDKLGSAERAIFRQRTQRFLANDEMGKRMQTEILGERYAFGRTGIDGHFGETIYVRQDSLRSGPQMLACVVSSNRRVYTNEVPIYAVGRSGISVVSDIDDTMKISNVRNRDELMRNTFLRPYRPVDGLANIYQQWARTSGAQFHYVSGSPWQLYPSLREFVLTNGFPAGSWHLRSVRILGISAINLLRSPDSHKRKAIEALFDRLPDRQFVLVGDSGERDPEIYGDLARRHPMRVAQIFIRDVTGESQGGERYTKAFKGVQAGSWLVFKSGGELPQGLPSSQNANDQTPSRASLKE